MPVKYYILTWDCKSEGLPWTREHLSAGTPEFTWSVYNTKSIKVGDQVFFLRQRMEPRGLIGLGTVIHGPESGPHWDDVKAAQGTQVLYVRVAWQHLSEEPLISIKSLLAEYPDIYWRTQRSGISAKDYGPAIERDFLSTLASAQGLAVRKNTDVPEGASSARI